MRISKRNWAMAGGLLCAAVYLIIKHSAVYAVAIVFLYAGAIAMMLSPLCTRLEKLGMKTAHAVLLAMFLVLLAILLLLSSFIPYLFTHTFSLIRRLMPTMEVLLGSVEELLPQWSIQLLPQIRFSQTLGAAISSLTTWMTRFGVKLAGQAGRITFSIIIAYYFLLERKTMGNHLLLLVPLHRRTWLLGAVQACRNGVSGYLSGLLKTSMFISLATFVGLLALGIEDALLLAFFMGILEILPYVGPLIASIPIVVSALSMGFEKTLFALLLIVVVQQIESNFISPYFTASSTSIHPLAALISVFVFGSFMGIWGVLLGVPIVVTLRSLYWSWQQANGG